MLYEHRKHAGSLPIIGVNLFKNPEGDELPDIELARSSDIEKDQQIARLEDFHQRHREAASLAIDDVRSTAIANGNVFAALMRAAECCSLGQLTEALFQVGGQYRRNL